jgi:hypothetical protein
MMRNESKLFFKLDDVPDNVVRYTGEVDYVHGEWANAKRVVKKTTEGGFAVMSDCGAWHFFNKDENKVEDILPKGLVFEVRMTPIPRK